MQWEYHVSYLDTSATIHDELDGWGREGWELVAVHRMSREQRKRSCSRSSSGRRRTGHRSRSLISARRVERNEVSGRPGWAKTP